MLALALERPHEFRPEERSALDQCADVFSSGVAKAAAYDEQSRLRGLFEAVGNATAAVAAEFELKPILRDIVEQAVRIVDAEYAALGIVTSEGRPFGTWVFQGMTSEQEGAIRTCPCPGGTPGLVALEGRTVRIADARDHPAFRSLPEGHPVFVGLLAVPLFHERRRVGTLYLANKRGAPAFDGQDERAMELFASNAGAAVYRSQLQGSTDAERARHTMILEKVPYGVHFVAAETEKLLVNPRGIELAGQSPRTLADYGGQPFAPDGRPLSDHEWPARRALRGEAFSTQEVIVRKPDGQEVPVLLNAVRVLRPDGSTEGAVVVYEDISVLKQLQVLREQWASIVIHDLRQPLSVITTCVTNLLRFADRQTMRRTLEQTQKAAHALSRMIDDLADASLIETKRLRLQLQPLELESLVSDVVEQHRAASPDRVVHLQGSGRPSIVFADPVRIEQVLNNLLLNAAKYAEPHTDVDVEVHSTEDEVTVRVTNRGAGIPAEEIPLIFDRYCRTGRTQAEGIRGLGLGLYIARGLVEAHDGRIWAESRPNETTTFAPRPPPRRSGRS